jgi:DNA-binding ferritin-like protein (Dps family)
MSFWETITGNDLTKQFKEFQQRAGVLPADYQAAWEQIVAHLFPYGNFSGRNLMPILDAALALLEEASADGQAVDDVLGNDIAGLSAALAGGAGALTHRDRWREQLNNNVTRKLNRLGN